VQGGEEAWEFSKKLADLGMSIQKYIIRIVAYPKLPQIEYTQQKHSAT